MSTFSENQSRKIFIATANTAAGVADVSALNEGEVQAFTTDGKKAVAAASKFLIATKKGGVIYNTEFIDSAKVLKTKKSANDTKLQKYSIAFTGTPVVGKFVDVVVFVDNYGANAGSGQPYPFHIGYTIQSGDTASSVVTGLLASLTAQANITSDINIYDDGSAAATFAFVAGRTPFALGRMAGEPLSTRLTVKTSGTGLSAAVTTSTVSSNNGYEIANIEWFDLGNTGDTYRGAGYPNSYNETYLAVAATAYTSFDVSYFSERMSAPGDKQASQVLVAIPTALIAQFETSLETVLGITL